MTNFYGILETVFERYATNDCLRLEGGQVWLYCDLLERVQQLSGVLVSQGVRTGDRVVVQVEKSPENLALYLATLRIGAVYVPLNTAYTISELEYFLVDAEPALFVGAQALGDVRCLTLSADGQGSLVDEMLANSVVVPELCDRDDEDLAVIIYTSGTTGRSKGAMLSHGNLSFNAHALSEAWAWQPDDVLLHALPIFHAHGLFIACHCALLNGTPMEFLAKFDVDRVQASLPRCTVMMGVPTFYIRLLAQPRFSEQDLSHIRIFLSGSAPLTEQVFKQWEAATGHRIVERYAMSETIVNTTNPVFGERIAATVGFPLPGISLRIADDQGQALPAGEVGMIEVAGPNVFGGYWRMPEKTKEEIRTGGFFITGDLGTVDHEGRVSIVGRSKDLVISGGYNVYPKEVERLIDEMPEVEESAVIGVSHPDLGEAVIAVLVPKTADVDIETVNAALSGQLARFKQPKKVINVKELPRNTMGKVQKNLLRDQFSDLF